MLKPKLPSAQPRRFVLATLQYGFEYGLIKLPRPVLIGVTQSRRFRTLFDSQVDRLAFYCRKATADLTQALGMTKLAEEHRHQLLPAGETACVPLRIVLLHGAFEFQPGKELENLAEYAAYSSHGRGLLLPLEIGSG